MPTEERTREPKDLRYRRQFFPEAEKLVFETKHKGFVPLPIILRKLLPHLTAAELRVLIYLYLRASRYGICYPNIDEIVHELGLTSRKNLTPHLESLAEKRFIATRAASGKTFFLIYDPRVPIEHLTEKGILTKEQQDEIDELYKDLRQEPLFSSELKVSENAPDSIPIEVES
jgi:DNA-binding MarR family transcriptional regulator